MKNNVHLETRLWSEDNCSLEKLLEAIIMHCLKQDFQQLKCCSCSSHVFWNLQAQFVSESLSQGWMHSLGDPALAGSWTTSSPGALCTPAVLWLKHWELLQNILIVSGEVGQGYLCQRGGYLMRSFGKEWSPKPAGKHRMLWWRTQSPLAKAGPAQSYHMHFLISFENVLKGLKLYTILAVTSCEDKYRAIDRSFPGQVLPHLLHTSGQ